jgi:vacuolar protein sorting-associated protein 72
MTTEEEDVVDSDFDEEEEPDDDVHGDDEDEGGGKRKRGRPTREQQAQRRAYQEPHEAAKRLRRATAATEFDGNAAIKKEGGTALAVAYEAPKLRQSTAKKSSESSDLRRKILEEASRLAAKAKKPPDVKARLTQEELLVEAVRTEVDNVQSLNRLERLEEEKKAESVITPKAPHTGLIVRYHSRIGMPKTITFLNTSSFPSIFDQKQPRKRERLAPKEEIVDDEDDDDDEEEDEEEEEEDSTREHTADEATDSK